MRSEEIMDEFPPIKLEKGISYLKEITGPMSSVIREFSELNDEQMVTFKYPEFVSKWMQDYREGKYSRDSDSFRKFNSAVTAINILKACAKLNITIYSLRNKYRDEEDKLASDFPSLSRYQQFLSTQPPLPEKYKRMAYNYTTDADILRIKDAVIDVRDRIHSYSKKNTLDGFDDNFISTIKYGVYSICNKFSIETRTITERATETGGNIIGNIIAFALFVLLFILVGKCTTGQ